MAMVRMFGMLHFRRFLCDAKAFFRSIKISLSVVTSSYYKYGPTVSISLFFFLDAFSSEASTASLASKARGMRKIEGEKETDRSTRSRDVPISNSIDVKVGVVGFR